MRRKIFWIASRSAPRPPPIATIPATEWTESVSRIHFSNPAVPTNKGIPAMAAGISRLSKRAMTRSPRAASKAPRTLAWPALPQMTKLLQLSTQQSLYHINYPTDLLVGDVVITRQINGSGADIRCDRIIDLKIEHWQTGQWVEKHPRIDPLFSKRLLQHFPGQIQLR